MACAEDDTILTAVTRPCRGYEKTLKQNWNGNVQFGGTPVVPSSVEELKDVVRDAPPPVRVIGRGHSFTPLAECSKGTLVSLARLNQVLDFCPPSCEEKIGHITVEGGTTYTEVAQVLGKRGALRNLPSCPQFTVAGAIATATHGSGLHIPNLSADVSMIEFIKADGTLKSYSRDDNRELLESVRVHLGCLGVVSRLTLDVVPFYEVESFRYDDVPLENMIENLPDLWNQCDSLSVWTSGFGHGHGAGQCWMTFRHFLSHWNESVAVPVHTRPQRVLGETGVLCRRAINRYCTDVDNPEMFKPSAKLPWYDALSLTIHDGQETSMTTVDIQSEFFVPLEHAQAAIRAVWEVAQEWTFSSPWGYTGSNPKRGFVDAMEFRQVKGGDGALLSPHVVDSLGIHVSFNGDNSRFPEVMEKLATLERALEPFDARAHWGKLAPLSFAPERLEELYGCEKLQCFRDICNLHDPDGKFRNSHIEAMFFMESNIRIGCKM